MIVLIVDDDTNKAKSIASAIRENFMNADISIEHSYQSGLLHIIKTKPPIVVLDMAMPTYDISPAERGGRPRPYAGRDILVEMKRRRIAGHVIVVTGYDRFGDDQERRTLKQLDAQLTAEFPAMYLGAIFYNPAASDWREALVDKLAEFAKVSGPNQ